MMYSEIIAVYSQIQTNHINTGTLCGQNVELLNIKLAVHIVTTGLWRGFNFVISFVRMQYIFNVFRSDFILYLSFVWFPPRLNFLCHLFGTLCLFRLNMSLKQEEFFRMFRNVGTNNTDGVLSPKRMNTVFIVSQRSENLKSRMMLYLLPSNYDKLCFRLLLF